MNDKLAPKQVADVILETVKTQKPETTQQLVDAVQEKTAFSQKEIMAALIKLENDGLLQFTRRAEPFEGNFRTYLFSKRTAWYWTIICFAIATTVAVLTIPSDVYPILYLRMSLAVVFVVFLPGFGFLKMFPQSKLPIKTETQDMEMIERFVISLGLSIALVPLVAVLLNYTPWGITLVSVTSSLLVLTVLFGSVAVWREYQKVVKENTDALMDKTADSPFPFLD
jgi:hypothetical protein